MSKSASDEGSVGQLICRAQGAPEISFQWIHKGSIIASDETLSSSSSSNDGKYWIEPVTRMNMITYQSVLKIRKVSHSDYGNYDCIARNELGFNRYTMNFNRTSKPDPPLAVRVSNRTSSTITLKWIPGFNGGLNQYFRIRYQVANNLPNQDDNDANTSSSLVSSTSSSLFSSNHPFMYTDVYPKNTTKFMITGLDDDQQYIFSVMAYNDLGESKYTEDIIKVRTLKGKQLMINKKKIMR